MIINSMNLLAVITFFFIIATKISYAVDKVVTVNGKKYNVTYKNTNYDNDTSFFTSGNLTWGNKSLAQSISTDVRRAGKSAPGVLIPYGTDTHTFGLLGIGGGGAGSTAVSIYWLDGNNNITDCPNACPTSSVDYWYAYTELARTAFDSRISKRSRSKILTILEEINTIGTNTSLITALDGLSDSALDKVSRQIEASGAVKKNSKQSINLNNSFKRAVSTSVSVPSVTSNTKNNYATLSLDDLLISNIKQKDIIIINNFNFKEFADIFNNKDLFSLKSEDSNFFVRLFGDESNQDKIGDDVGSETSTYGILIGNENKKTEEIEQGWVVGISDANVTFDEGFGGSNSNVFHAMFYQNLNLNNYYASINLGSFVSQNVLNRKITEGSPQTLKSTSYNCGIDINTEIKKSIELEKNLIITPSFSTNFSYVVQDDIDETGGDLALTINNDNLLIFKPEIGLSVNKDFQISDDIVHNLGLSVFGNHEIKIDGTNSNAKIKSTSSNFNIVEENEDEQFFTAGLSYNFNNKIKNTSYNLSLYQTQNSSNSLNSTLISFNYIKKF